MGLVFIKIMSALCAVEQPRAWTISARFTPGTSDQSLQSVPPHRREHDVPFDWLDSKYVFPSFLLVPPTAHRNRKSNRNQLSQSSK